MKYGFILLFLFLSFSIAIAQSTNATISGGVTDPSGKFIQGADVEIANDATGVVYSSRTNGSGMYVVPILPPGHYHVQISKPGFRTIIKADIVLNVQSALALNFVLPVGSTSESVTVDADSSLINTTDASVSTVVDQKFVKNIPLNGRSFQDLISLTPGVVTQSPQQGGSVQAQGDFSVNGQRTESNYYMIDGLSANTGAGSANGTGGFGQTGSIAASSALGTTQNLISVDALQEFRVSSSSYSAEYGRMPGGQFSFSSRSGTNTLHGTIFDYLRNDFFDANDWFNDYYGIREPALRQNDFGGTVGGPILLPRLYDGRSKSFFFVSYEGLRLVQPTNASAQYVPSLSLRQDPALNAAMRSLLNAFPLPTGNEIELAGNLSGLASFVEAYSLPSSIDATSVRFDRVISDKATAFFRYSYSPTSISSRNLSSPGQTQQNSETFTAGLDNSFSTRISNDFRIGFAASRAVALFGLDSFGGAVPVDLQTEVGAPGVYDTYSYFPYISISGVGSAFIESYKGGNSLRQWNVTDAVAISLGRHQLRLGLDERHLTSPLGPAAISVYPYFFSPNDLAASQTSYLFLRKTDPARPTFNEFSAFIQDEWQIRPEITVSTGVRWDINPAPGAADGHPPYTVLGNVFDPASLTLAPRGTRLWNTSWYNFAPRLGVAWKARSAPGWESVVRTGGGVFFDTGNQVGAYGFSGLGFLASNTPANSTMPFAASDYDFTTAVSAPYTDSFVYAYPRHMQLPYSLQWNLSLDQALGRSQALTISYLGSDGRRLLQEQYRSVNSFNPLFGIIYYYPEGVTSNYQALQVKFQRNVVAGLQVLGSYTWSHALDFGSTTTSLPLTYGNADFDVRHNLQAALSWDIPRTNQGSALKWFTNGWGVDGRLNVRSAFPITLTGNVIVDPTGSYSYGSVNYDSSKPAYLYGSQYPGGRILNGGPNVAETTAAFSLPTGTDTGNAPRNFVRGFGAHQINTAIRRDFPIHGDIHLSFRAEAFNVLNQPNFGYIDPTLTDLQFGEAIKMLNASLASMSSLYQQGGARSMQFSLKLGF
ncbi:carboxypeptidase regulatory-like domain-containing protein [Acidicapsa dinghuensis]|uniref:Carboxypeptidase regulatory-like domain-containing protein n=1 Tax=Acidicapsa dinghuensis TaxID=2218256 RepID=A0ABW1EBX8_9BACT|nr:TonB-dependent receptor [Acidicapsa dinghuensis]